jgi:hypothetical protein
MNFSSPNAKYFVMLVASLCCCFVFFMMAVMGRVNFFALVVAFACCGILFGYLYPMKKWQVGILLTAPYVVLLSWAIAATLLHNQHWNGVFWQTQIFYSAVYLYLTPIIAAIAGVLIGSTRSIVFVTLLTVLLVSTVMSEIYIRDHHYISRASSGSFEMGNEGLRLHVDLNCKYTKYNNHEKFLYVESGGCGDARVTVLARNPTYNLPTTSAWVIDGTETPGTMWPINSSNGGSYVDKFYPHAYDNVTTWRATIPVAAITKAQQAEFRWGDSNIQLDPAQIESLRKLQKEFAQLCRGL